MINNDWNSVFVIWSRSSNKTYSLIKTIEKNKPEKVWIVGQSPKDFNVFTEIVSRYTTLELIEKDNDKAVFKHSKGKVEIIRVESPQKRLNHQAAQHKSLLSTNNYYSDNLIKLGGGYQYGLRF